VKKIRDYEQLSRKIYSELGRNPRKALKLAEKEISISRKEKDFQGLARMVLSRAHAFREMGKYREAIHDYDQAASLFRKYGEEIEAARTAIGKMDALDQLGKYSEALKIAKAARRIFRRAKLPLLIARVDVNTGNIYHRTGQYSLALKYYGLAHDVLAKARPLDGYVVLFNQATVFLCQRNPKEAFDPLNKCISFFEQKSLFSFLGRTHYNLAYAYFLLGKYQDSLHYIAKARGLFEKLQDRSFLASCYMDEAELYLRLNQSDEALDMAKRARKRFDQLAMPYELAETNVILGIVLLRKNLPLQAIKFLKEAQSYFQSFGNQTKSAELDLQIAHAFSLLHENRKAILQVEKAYRIFSRQKIYSRMLSCLTQIGSLIADKEDWSKSANTLRKANGWIKRVHLPWVLLSYYQLRGRVESKLGLKSAATHLRMAIQLVERMRVEIPAEDLRISYLQDKLAPYDTLIGMELADGTKKGSWNAFQFSERAKSRVLLDLLGGSLSFDRDSEESAQLFAEMNSLDRDSWRRSIGGVGVASPFREKKIKVALRRIQVSHKPERAETLSHLEIQNALEPDQALLSFYWIGDRLNAFVFSRNGMVSYPSVADFKSTLMMFNLFRFQIERKRMDPDTSLSGCDSHLEGLFSRLIEPLYPAIQRYRSWTIIPHKWLHGLPFHCLKNGSEYLAERHRIQYAPSVSIFLRTKQQQRFDGNMLLIGHEDHLAPLIQEEVRAIHEIVPSAHLLNGSEADSRHLQKMGPLYRTIHIASHGRFQQDQSLFSGVLLADGWLTLPQIYQLKLNAILVVLSGCETGGHDIQIGDELLGLVRSFLYAGAESLLVSLWRVSDHSTAFFMKQFYLNLTGGRTKLESWNRALIETKTKWDHPYHWGPFQLIC
jgi:CHAT domain-containing protein/tetratricopeptide (TPR) repeat protein